jgi:adenylate kinase family enzyme
VRRVVLVGPPGSGKSTLARALADCGSLPYVELDALYWGPNWTPADDAAFDASITAALAGDAWVVDGNYFTRARDTAWPRADTVVWLDLPRWLTFTRVVRRTVVRSARRTELWNGNRETFRLGLRSDSVVWFSWREHARYRTRYEPLAADPALAHLTWVRLRTRGEVRRWLASVAAGEQGLDLEAGSNP